MDETAIATVRGFNRTVTERVGALNEEYLARGRPLGASRVLWEVGDDGVDVRSLRTRLDLDSGYLSRLLHGLDREGLVEIGPSEHDGRVRTVRLTGAGLRERAVLDERSDALARSLLAPLREGQRARLLEAMATVERLLTAGLVTVAIEPPASDAARYCLDSYAAELNERFEAGFDPTVSISAGAEELAEPRGLLIVARLRGEPVGCGALKLQDTVPAYIKRMWVAPRARGLGLGRRLLAELEAQARARGATRAHLETNAALVEAIALYRSAGYVEVPPFNDEPYAHHWFAKRL
jgi:GNAT superfamily N-acetyltransferase/DNA-binding MarR family transcriptional regulator